METGYADNYFEMVSYDGADLWRVTPEERQSTSDVLVKTQVTLEQAGVLT